MTDGGLDWSQSSALSKSGGMGLFKTESTTYGSCSSCTLKVLLSQDHPTVTEYTSIPTRSASDRMLTEVDFQDIVPFGI